MTWPPSMLRVRVREKDKDFGLWLPIFLVWPVALVLVLALLPLGLVAAAATGRFGAGKRRLHWRLPTLLVAPLMLVLAVLLLALATLPMILVVILLAIPGGILWVLSVKVSGRRRPPAYLFPPLLAVLAVAALPLLLMALALAVVQLPFVLVAALLLWQRDIGRLLLMSGPRFVGLLCALRGLKVDVRNGRNQVFVSLW